MTIHPATAKKAQQAGITLTETDEAYRAYSSKHHISMEGNDPPQLLKNILAACDMRANHKTFKWVFENGAYQVSIVGMEITVQSQHLDYAFKKAKEEWTNARAEMSDEDLEALEELQAEELGDEEPEGAGSVVKEKYRQLYKEQGHPNHCGDDLAVFLGNYCKSPNGSSLAIFESVCGLNGVDLSKYNRTSHGWQGRLRMTGRNILARKVYAAGGVLKLLDDSEHRMSEEWMADQQFKGIIPVVPPAPPVVAAALTPPDAAPAEPPAATDAAA